MTEDTDADWPLPEGWSWDHSYAPRVWARRRQTQVVGFVDGEVSMYPYSAPLEVVLAVVRRNGGDVDADMRIADLKRRIAELDIHCMNMAADYAAQVERCDTTRECEFSFRYGGDPVEYPDWGGVRLRYREGGGSFVADAWRSPANHDGSICRLGLEADPPPRMVWWGDWRFRDSLYRYRPKSCTAADVAIQCSIQETETCSKAEP